MFRGKTKAVAILIVMIAYVIILSGCQTAPAFFSDVAGTAQYIGDKLQSQADKAKERDAELRAKWLMRYTAEQRAIAGLNADVTGEDK